MNLLHAGFQSVLSCSTPYWTIYLNVLAFPNGMFSVEKYWIKLVWLVSRFIPQALPVTGCAWISSFEASRVVYSLKFIFILTLRKLDNFSFQKKLLKHVCLSFVIGLMPVDADENLSSCCHVSQVGQRAEELWQVAQGCCCTFLMAHTASSKTSMTFNSVEVFQCELNALLWNPWLLFIAVIFTLQFECRKGNSPRQGKLIRVYLKVTTGKLLSLPWNKDSESTVHSPNLWCKYSPFLGKHTLWISNSSCWNCV